MLRFGIMATLGLTIAACTSGGGPSDNAATANTSVAIGNTIAASAAPTGPLDAWVGKHPSEKVDGLTFLAQPSVKAAVAAVPDAKVRDFVHGYNGPDAPIVKKDGRVLAWGCEKHNCGYHNWSVSITPDGSSAEVCFYQNDAKPDGASTWYVAAGKTEQRPGNCPSE